MNYPTYPNFSNYYPNYPTYQQPIQYNPPIQTAQNTQNQILAWVQSEDEGFNYPLNAGQSIFLMNQKEPYLYMKSVDQLGKSTFIKKRLMDEGNTEENKIDLKDYVRKEELENLIMDRIQEEVEKRVSQISFKPTRKKTKVVEDDEE